MLAADFARRRGGRAPAALFFVAAVLKGAYVNECGSAQSQTETLPGVDNSRRDILVSCDRSNLSQEEVEGASTTSKGTDITQKEIYSTHTTDTPNDDDSATTSSSAEARNTSSSRAASSRSTRSMISRIFRP